MLLFTRQQCHLYFIQVYLQGGQSILKGGPHQLIVFSSIRPVHAAQTGPDSFRPDSSREIEKGPLQKSQ